MAGLIESVTGDWKSLIKNDSNNFNRTYSISNDIRVSDKTIVLQEITSKMAYTMFLAINETSLHVFQYKILNNIIYLNSRLHKFGFVESPLFSLCNREPSAFCIHFVTGWGDELMVGQSRGGLLSCEVGNGSGCSLAAD